MKLALPNLRGFLPSEYLDASKLPSLVSQFSAFFTFHHATSELPIADSLDRCEEAYSKQVQRIAETQEELKKIKEKLVDCKNDSCKCLTTIIIDGEPKQICCHCTRAYAMYEKTRAAVAEAQAEILALRVQINDIRAMCGLWTKMGEGDPETGNDDADCKEADVEGLDKDIGSHLAARVTILLEALT